MRDRGGWTIVAMLMAMLILGMLWAKQAKVMLPVKGGAPTEQQQLPEKARVEMFKMTALGLRNAAAMHQANAGKPITSWNEASRLGINTAQKDPWGGQYYIKSGMLRCTGNPKVSEPID